MKSGRRKPYSAIGISRVRCSKRGCMAPGRFQWQCCALDNRWFALCAEHDVGLNEVACNYLLGRAAGPVIRKYRRRVMTS